MIDTTNKKTVVREARKGIRVRKVVQDSLTIGGLKSNIIHVRENLENITKEVERQKHTVNMNRKRITEANAEIRSTVRAKQLKGDYESIANDRSLLAESNERLTECILKYESSLEVKKLLDQEYKSTQKLMDNYVSALVKLVNRHNINVDELDESVQEMLSSETKKFRMISERANLVGKSYSMNVFKYMDKGLFLRYSIANMFTLIRTKASPFEAATNNEYPAIIKQLIDSNFDAKNKNQTAFKNDIGVAWSKDKKNYNFVIYYKGKEVYDTSKAKWGIVEGSPFHEEFILRAYKNN